MMTADEIVTSYKQSKNKQQQIQILADLNACSKDNIKNILRENGIDLRGGVHKKKEPEPEIEIPEEHLCKRKIPDEIRKQLSEDLDQIVYEINNLITRKIAIESFLKEE